MEAKIHHYVPKFLIRNFGMGKKNQVWVYDKTNSRSFPSNAKNVASENRFYEFDVGGTMYSLESSLSRIETKSKELFDKILAADSTGSLKADDRSTLSSFLAIQFIRTKSFRAQWSEMPGLLREKLEAAGDRIAAGSQAEAITRDPTENEVKVETARMLVDAPETYGPHFLNKVWFLAKTTKLHPFVLGDNPISLQNQIDMGPFGNLGLALRGIEIYLPLSSTRALVMWCPSLAQQVSDAAATIRSLPRSIIANRIRDPEGILATDTAVRTGCTLDYQVQHVRNFNALQIGRSERYVFSSINDFSLADEMMKAHPSLRAGPRMTMS